MTSDQAGIRQYIEENKDRFFEELFSLMRIPSVSAKPENKQDMWKCAERYAELLREAGADEAGVFPTEGNPVVFGQKIIDPTYKTALVYGHYDVQPAEPLEKWNSDPFEPEIHDGAIWGRGANDDKGQTFMHVKAFEYLVRNGLLKHNVKFIFEGEEEVGSKNLPAWVEANKERLACDVILVSDTTMLSDKVPSINCGMRGVTYLQVNVKGPDKDLHSGHYGGAVANPINTLCDMISSLIDKDGRITIPGFYDDVEELSAEDRASLARAPFDMEEYKESIVEKMEAGNGFLIPITSPAYKAASRAMTEVYGIEPVPSRGGGSICVLADMRNILGADPLLMGFGLERDTIHSPNESYLLRQFYAGIESVTLFYEYWK